MLDLTLYRSSICASLQDDVSVYFPHYYRLYYHTFQFVDIIISVSIDVTLTRSNLLSAVATVTKWDELGYRLRIPTFKRNKIRYQYDTDPERKEALIEDFLLHHPAPNWKEVALALYRMKHHDLLGNVYDWKFLTGTFFSLPLMYLF